MASIGEKIRDARKNASMTQVELAKATNLSRSYIGDIEKDRYNPSVSTLQAIAKATNVPVENLLGGDASTPPAPKVTRYTYRITVVGRVAAGQPILAQEEIIDYEYIDERLHKSGDQYFGLVVKGASMEPTIHDGDTIIVRVQESVESGQIAVVLVDGEDATVKEVKETDTGLTLIGHNVAVYAPHFYSREEVEKLPVRIIGRVIQSISKF
ncbi:helix-turn-helix domain-containing protein [Selenomonas sp. WCA-380-WT-3B 3/]|uniref:Helix-turn-helix domain-containing protein n=1 Tax=Selenomonas montiformis TaxID=2652285 RepID=A0A6I2V376_9FIRM|nr:XRE family transcriptional regulator [Selenomonas montiformis]MSV25912.1 helix-turn-helix domain-containing protein [Selenomonas montiformis]